MTYAEVKQRLLDAVDGANEAHGVENSDKLLMAAVETFPECAEDVPVYRESLKRLAPEMRAPLDYALSLLIENEPIPSG